MNGRLDTPDTITPPDGDAGAWAGGVSGAEPPSYRQIPAPPPPPPLSRQALREQRSQATRQLRSLTFRGLVRWASSQHRAWYWFFGVLAVLFAGSLFALWFTGAMVRAATAESTAAGPTPTSIVYRASMPNPLKQVKLTPEAAVILGAHDSDGDGKMDALDDVKSSGALATILKATDLCAWFVTVDASFEPVLSQTVTPGAVKLATCADPISPTTVAPSAMTAVPTTTTTAPAK